MSVLRRYLQVREEYIRERLYVKQNDSLSVVWRLVCDNTGTRIAVVIDNDKNFLGIITSNDINSVIRTYGHENAMELTVADCYNKTPVTISKAEFLMHKSNGTKLFENIKVRNLIVLDGNKCHAIVCAVQPIMNIDIVDTCNLHCQTCPQGRGQLQSSAGKMNPELFDSIMDKAHAYGCNNIRLYNWTEPFLCDDLAKYVEIAASHGITAGISTNLSLPVIKDLKCILYTPGSFVVSVSGFTQEIHQVNHCNSNIDVVKKHLKYISDCYVEKIYCRSVVVKYLTFDYNTHEIAQFRSFVESLPGIKFSAHPGVGDPQAARKQNNKRHQNNSIEMMDVPNDIVCKLFYDMTIDYRGNVYLCCAKPTYLKYRLGHCLDDSFGDILQKRAHHPECKKCNATDKIYKMPLTI